MERDDRPTLSADATLSTAELPPVSGDGASAPRREPPRPEIPGFEIIRFLDEGGMGMVWLAQQTATGRQVALKVLPPSRAGSGSAEQRFGREIALASKLDHPGIAAVYDGGVWPGGRYYAMAYVEGGRLDRTPGFVEHDPRQVVSLLAQVAEAIQHAHQRGVMHRDIKPSNVMMHEDGRPVVVDFGLAKAVEPDDDQPQMTAEGATPGTLAFMSPEQAAGDGRFVDTRSDVYSLGATLYYGLVGNYPVEVSNSLLETLSRIRRGEIKSPKSQGYVLETDLEAVLMKSLEADVDRRYGTAGELEADLRRWLTGDPVQAKPQTLAYVINRRAKQFVKRHTQGVVATALGVVLACVGLVIWSQRGAQVPIYTDPPGAAIWINDKPHYCPSNCRVFLGAGTHRVTLRQAGEGTADGVSYREVERLVRVGWGGYRYEGNQSVVLPPAFRHIRFEAPAGTQLTVYAKDDGRVVAADEAPLSARLDAGMYELVAESPTGQTLRRKVEVIGGSEPRIERVVFETETD